MTTDHIHRARQKRGFVEWLFLLPFILAGGVLAGIGVLMLAGAFLVTQGSTKGVDTIVILSGGGPERAVEAANIYREHKGSIVMLTLSRASGSTSKAGLPPYAYYYKLYQGGVPAENIVLTWEVSDSTSDEAKAVLESMQRLNLKKGVVVTDPYHTRRAEWIFRDAFRESGIKITVRAAKTHWYHSYDWFMSRRGWTATLTEFAKLLAFITGLDR